MSSDEGFLDAAESIGRRIVHDAVWHGARCNWMGAIAHGDEPWRLEYHALDSNLYDGTAGVGLFLARLAAATGDMAVRRTAVGAMRHAVERALAIPPDARDGFHGGSLGIAWAAASAAAILDEEELRGSAANVLTDARPSRIDRRCPDIRFGAAGSVVALLALAETLDNPALLEDALATGEELIGRATVNRYGWSWAIPGRHYRHHLCGLSHGAAGIGWALLELFAVSGDTRFSAGATGAFEYERSWLDAASGTWPDLRIGGQRRGPGRGIAAPAVGTWCHREGGIALTRLRASEVLGDEACAADAGVALEATRRALAGTLPYEIDDMTLCHGAAGAADVLLCGAAALGAASDSAAELATEVGRVALKRHGGADGAWPRGVAGGTTPGLFRGLSGIGWWFLRLHDGATPSPLTMPIRG